MVLVSDVRIWRRVLIDLLLIWAAVPEFETNYRREPSCELVTAVNHRETNVETVGIVLDPASF